MTIDCYYTVVSPPARTVAVLAKHLKLEVNFIETRPYDGDTRTAQYLALNPGHTIPTIVDDGFALFESRAILAYLVNQYAPGSTLYPSEPRARAAVDKVLYFEATGFSQAMKTVFFARFMRKVEVSAEAAADLAEKTAILEAILGEQAFFTGDHPTIADISLGVAVPLLQFVQSELYSAKLSTWYERVGRAIPALVELNGQADRLYKERMEADAKLI